MRELGPVHHVLELGHHDAERPVLQLLQVVQLREPVSRSYCSDSDLGFVPLFPETNELDPVFPAENDTVVQSCVFRLFEPFELFWSGARLGGSHGNILHSLVKADAIGRVHLVVQEFLTRELEPFELEQVTGLSKQNMAME